MIWSSWWTPIPAMPGCSTAVTKRLREELALLQVEVNEEKSRIVDLAKGEAFGFLGFAFRRVRSRRGVWWPQRTPRAEEADGAAAEAQGGLPALPVPARRAGDRPRSTRCCAAGSTTSPSATPVGASPTSATGWRQKVRRHLMRARNRPGLGWKRWSRRWLYGTLGLYGDYRVQYRRAPPKALPTAIGPITLGVKRTGKRGAGNPHAPFDVAGAGDGPTANPKRARSWKRRIQPRGAYGVPRQSSTLPVVGAGGIRLIPAPSTTTPPPSA